MNQPTDPENEGFQAARTHVGNASMDERARMEAAALAKKGGDAPCPETDSQLTTPGSNAAQTSDPDAAALREKRIREWGIEGADTTYIVEGINKSQRADAVSWKSVPPQTEPDAAAISCPFCSGRGIIPEYEGKRTCRHCQGSGGLRECAPPQTEPADGARKRNPCMLCGSGCDEEEALRAELATLRGERVTFGEDVRELLESMVEAGTVPAKDGILRPLFEKLCNTWHAPVAADLDDLRAKLAATQEALDESDRLRHHYKSELTAAEQARQRAEEELESAKFLARGAALIGEDFAKDADALRRELDEARAERSLALGNLSHADEKIAELQSFLVKQSSDLAASEAARVRLADALKSESFLCRLALKFQKELTPDEAQEVEESALAIKQALSTPMSDALRAVLYASFKEGLTTGRSSRMTLQTIWNASQTARNLETK